MIIVLIPIFSILLIWPKVITISGFYCSCKSFLDFYSKFVKDLSLYRQCVLFDLTLKHFAQHKSKIFGRQKCPKLSKNLVSAFRNMWMTKLTSGYKFQRNKSTHTHSQTHTYRHRHTHTHTLHITHSHSQTQTHTQTHRLRHRHTNTHTHNTHAHITLHTLTSYTHSQTHTHRHRHTHTYITHHTLTLTDTDTDTHTHKHTDSDADTQTLTHIIHMHTLHFTHTHIIHIHSLTHTHTHTLHITLTYKQTCSIFHFFSERDYLMFYLKYQ